MRHAKHVTNRKPWMRAKDGGEKRLGDLHFQLAWTTHHWEMKLLIPRCILELNVDFI